MRIAVISDTHNQEVRVQKVAQWLRKENITTLIHCGDLVDPSLLKHFEGMQVYYVYGNGDYATGEAREILQAMNRDNECGISLHLEIEGKYLFITHGHKAGLVEKAVASGLYDYVLQGHTHRFTDETHVQTRLLNPGALGGTPKEAHGFAILNLADGSFQRLDYEQIQSD